MSILIAGATGLVGSAIVRELDKSGKPNTGISSKDLDLLDRAATFKFIKDLKPSVVINAAARVGGIVTNNANPVEFLSQNIQMQVNLMDASHAANVERFIFFGSNCIYPKYSQQPIKEKFLLTGELEPTNSAYAIAKISGIRLVQAYRQQYSRRWISLMPVNLYGPNDNFNLETGHVFPALVRKFVDAVTTGAKHVTLWGTGTPKREFMHVDDLVGASLFCLENYDEDEHINIGTGTDLEIWKIAEKIARTAGFTGDILWDKSKPDGTPQKLLDNSRISNLGWRPSISLDQGIVQTVQWYKENNLEKTCL